MTLATPVAPTTPWAAAWPAGLPRQLETPRRTLADALDAAAERHPDKPALLFFGQATSFAQLRADADALAAHLQQRAGVRAGDRVLLLSQNCPQFTIAFQAIVRCGAVVVPVNAMSTASELDHFIADSGARVAMLAQELLPAAQAALDDGRLQHAVVHCYADALGAGVDASADLCVPDAVSAPRLALTHPRVAGWAAALAAGVRPSTVAIDADDLCVLPYTSGTTGRPKGCMHTHATLLASTLAAVRWRGLHADSVVLGVAPLFHLLGMQNALLMPMAVGATVVLMPRWDAATAARLIERARVSAWAAPPAMLNDFFAHPEAQQRDLSSLAILNGGGAPMPEAVAEMLKSRFGLSYIEGYGLTETASFLHCSPLGRGKRQCLGIPTFGVDSRIVDPETLAELPPGQTGELVTSAAQLMRGYWRDDAANAAAFFERDGRRYFRTGDLAVMDDEGYFFLRDRLKRMINVSGFKVWPAEIESLLYAHPALHEACVVAAPDARQGESVRAVVVCRPGAVLDAAQLEAWCRERMAAYKVPRRIEFRAALPKSSTGKVLWRVLQEECTAAPAPVAAPASGRERHVPFLGMLGMRRESVGDGVAVVALDLHAELLNNHGAGHGGVVMTLLDSAMANAALSRIDFAREVVTIDMHIGFMRPSSGRLRATGRATGGGRSVCFCEAELVDDSGEVVAKAMGTFRYRTPV
ncbi:long-chain-fatty-acid--CoA ligase [Acidovorax sp. CCYZU-2555]|uniref:long-chain-fatty-acid--CoA ligase n=1 Tax=Acidovorax sp. CCYZU-2555 TaxID=2835042 RepID=UPI001BCDCD1F|nr:AMP-binding protein [Acidovorax sp. CCYZU-2555]